MNLQQILTCTLFIPLITPHFPLDCFVLSFSFYNKYPRETVYEERRFCGRKVFGVLVPDRVALGLRWAVHQGGTYPEKHSCSPHGRKTKQSWK